MCTYSIEVSHTLERCSGKDVSGTPGHPSDPSSDFSRGCGGPPHGSSNSSFTDGLPPEPVPSFFQSSALKSPSRSEIPSATLSKGVQW